jgi:site-specific DNA-methyltransferase (adenine-specific)
MQQIPSNSVDMILCDLPYGMLSCDWDKMLPLEKMWELVKHIKKNNCPVLLFSSQPFTTKLINSNLSDYGYELVWKKNVPTGMAQAKHRPMKYHETIQCFCMRNTTYNPIFKERVGKHKECYNYDHYCTTNKHINLAKVKKRYDPNYVQPSTILEFNVVPNRKGKVHPTQKPIELMEYLIKTYTNEGDTVLDFTMGSGTTGVACKNTNRNFIGIELDENYFKIAEDRINV